MNWTALMPGAIVVAGLAYTLGVATVYLLQMRQPELPAPGPITAEMKQLELWTFRMLQHDVGLWSDYNFGAEDEPVNKLLGMVEELGELAHAHLKARQQIRGSAAEHEAKAKDAVGDLFVYAANYCHRRKWNMQEIVVKTWLEVRKRDWRKYPLTGLPPDQPVYVAAGDARVRESHLAE